MPVPCSFCTDKRSHDLFEELNPQFLHVITDSLYAIKELCYHCQNLLKYNDKFDEDCLCVCRKVHFEVFRRIVANASWVRKCALSARKNSWPVTMCYTDEGAWTVLHSSLSPLPAILLTTAPMRDISQWKPPSLTITFPSSFGDSATIFEIFWYHANKIPFPPAKSVMVNLSCKQGFFFWGVGVGWGGPAVCRFALFVHSTFQLGKRILTFIIFFKEGTKTVKCRPLFCIPWMFCSFFIGEPTRRVSYIAPFTILCFGCHQINDVLCPRKNNVSSFIFSLKSSGNYSLSLSLILMVLSLSISSWNLGPLFF